MQRPLLGPFGICSTFCALSFIRALLLTKHFHLWLWSRTRISAAVRMVSLDYDIFNGCRQCRSYLGPSGHRGLTSTNNGTLDTSKGGNSHKPASSPELKHLTSAQYNECIPSRRRSTPVHATITPLSTQSRGGGQCICGSSGCSHIDNLARFSSLPSNRDVPQSQIETHEQLCLMLRLQLLQRRVIYPHLTNNIENSSTPQKQQAKYPQPLQFWPIAKRYETFSQRYTNYHRVHSNATIYRSTR